MISIRRYLDSERRNEAAKPAPDLHFPDNLYRLSSAILDSIHESVLTGDTNKVRQSQIQQVKNSLRPDLTADEASQAGATVAGILAAHQGSVKRSATDQLIEAQHIFAMLNQALVVLAEGNERGVSLLGTIQESLHKASTMRDMASLKASLAETVHFIQTEAERSRETAAEELGKFETEVNSAREFFGGTRLELGGRREGVSEISDSLKSLVPGEAVYLVAYLWDRLNAVTHRYGPAVAEELIFRLIQERLKPVMPSNTMYRWTPSSLVGVFSGPRNAEKLRSEVAKLNRTPLVHKIALNGRTAVLTVSPSHLVAESGSEPSAALVEQVDRFTRV